MIKLFVNLIVAILFSLLLINPQSIAHHKENSLTIQKDTEWDGNKETKKDFENKANKDFCALSSKAVSVKEAGKPVIDQNTGKQTINENGNPVFEEIIVYKINVTGSHLTEAKKVKNNKLYPSLASMNLNANWDKIKLVEVLKMFCLQDSTKDKTNKFKGSYLEEFYKKVALDNGFFKANSNEGDYSKKLLEGESGEEILKLGLVINNPNAVWHVPDFLAEQEAANKKAAKDAAEKAEKERIAAEKESSS